MTNSGVKFFYYTEFCTFMPRIYIDVIARTKNSKVQVEKKNINFGIKNVNLGTINNRYRLTIKPILVYLTQQTNRQQ